MGIPTSYKISESGTEQGSLGKFRGTMVYRMPQSVVETYRSDFTPGLDTGGVVTTASVVSSAGVVTGYSASFAATHVGNPITIGAYGTYYIDSYTSTSTVDTSYTNTVDVTTQAITVQSSKTWPGKTGLFAPRLHDYRLEPQYPGVPDHSRLTLWYQTPAIQQLVEESTGRAMIEMDVMGIGERMQREAFKGNGATARIIEGPAYDQGRPSTKYDVIRGSNVSWRPGITQFVIKAATTQANVDSVNAKAGMVNDRELPNFGSPGTGTLMFLGAKLGNRLPVSSLWMGHHYFARDPGEMSGSTFVREPWHCRSLLQQQAVMALPVMNTAGTAISNQTAMVTMLMPVSGQTSVDRVVHRGSANFASFNTKLEWLNGL